MNFKFKPNGMTRPVLEGSVYEANTVYEDDSSLIVQWRNSQNLSGIISLITTKTGEIHIDSEQLPIGAVAEILKKWLETVRIGPFSIN